MTKGRGGKGCSPPHPGPLPRVRGRGESTEIRSPIGMKHGCASCCYRTIGEGRMSKLGGIRGVMLSGDEGLCHDELAAFWHPPSHFRRRCHRGCRGAVE